MIVCGALVVPPASTVFTPQDLAHKLVALDYGNGTAYAGLQMLEGAMPREAITTCAAPTSPAERFSQLMHGDFEATVLQEPWPRRRAAASSPPRSFTARGSPLIR